MIRLNKNYKLLWGIVVFFLIFAFPIGPGLSSAKLVLIIIVFILLSKRNFQEQLHEIKRVFRRFLPILIFIAIITIFQTIIFLQFDFSLCYQIVSSIFLYIISFITYNEVKKYYELPKLVIICFVLQSIFILLAVLSQEFFDLTQPFRADISDNNMLAYGRLRGNAIAGYQYFGISATYTFVIIYLILHYKEVTNKSINYLITLVVINIAGILSGRYAVVGIIEGLIFLFINFLRTRQVGRIIKVTIFLFLGISILVSLLFNWADSIDDPMMRKIVESHIIQPIESITEDGSFHSDSTDRLEEMYQSEDIKQYFTFGSGRYTTPDGHYFGGIDIGYYRMLGYYGYFGYLIVIFGTYYLLFKTRSNLDKLTRIAFFSNFIILNLKGDVNIWSNNIIPILVAFLFFYNPKQIHRSHVR